MLESRNDADRAAGLTILARSLPRDAFEAAYLQARNVASAHLRAGPLVRLLEAVDAWTEEQLTDVAATLKSVSGDLDRLLPVVDGYATMITSTDAEWLLPLLASMLVDAPDERIATLAPLIEKVGGPESFGHLDQILDALGSWFGTVVDPKPDPDREAYQLELDFSPIASALIDGFAAAGDWPSVAVLVAAMLQLPDPGGSWATDTEAMVVGVLRRFPTADDQGILELQAHPPGRGARRIGMLAAELARATDVDTVTRVLSAPELARTPGSSASWDVVDADVTAALRLVELGDVARASEVMTFLLDDEVPYSVIRRARIVEGMRALQDGGRHDDSRGQEPRKLPPLRPSPPRRLGAAGGGGRGVARSRRQRRGRSAPHRPLMDRATRRVGRRR